MGESVRAQRRGGSDFIGLRDAFAAEWALLDP